MVFINCVAGNSTIVSEGSSNTGGKIRDGKRDTAAGTFMIFMVIVYGKDKPNGG